MKWYKVLVFAALAVAPVAASSQRIQNVSIGNIPHIDDRAPTTWGMSGMEMVHITQTVGNVTPIMRTMAFDARTVEILSRTQSPPLRWNDIRTVSQNGRQYVVVRRFKLIEVTPQDARAEGISTASLAQKWASSVRRVLPQVAPMPNRFGQ